jgi:hypothetical protein
MAVIATVPLLTFSALPDGARPTHVSAPEVPSPFPHCLMVRFRPAGRLTFFACAKKVSKETHPGIRVSLRSTPLLPVPLRGPAYKGHPCPFTPLAASLRPVPLRNTSTRPANGEFARMKVSRFRQARVVGLPTATEQPRRRVDNAACGLSTSSTQGGQRCAVAHPTNQSVIVPRQSMRSIDAHTTNSNARTTKSPAHQKLGPGSGPVRRLRGIVV